MSIDANTKQRQNNVEARQRAYTNASPITTAKYKDIIFLYEQNLNPSRYHNFYETVILTKKKE